MNKKIIQLLKTKKIKKWCMLDAYNQKVISDISCTITTRVSASNEIYVVVEEEENGDKKV